MTRAIFIGRFQPFHKGHLHSIEKIAGENKEIIIFIGSSQKSGTAVNPFTYSERKKMIVSSLKENNISNYKIYPLKDSINGCDKWFSGIIKKVPKFDFIYTGNPDVYHAFRKRGYKVKKLRQINRKQYSGTAIRKRLKV